MQARSHRGRIGVGEWVSAGGGGVWELGVGMEELTW